jgi:hypothetical protein
MYTKEYSYQDCQFVLLGRPTAGVLGIKYKGKGDRKYIWATGRKPITYVDGQEEYEGEVTLLQSEFEAIVRSLLPGGTITTLPPFDIVVMYVPNTANPVIVKDIIKGVLLTDWEKAGKSGDTNMEITLPFKAADVQLNAK